MTEFYTYAYLREDGTPYYIGKGKNNRAHFTYNHNIPVPKDKNRILFLKQNLTEEEAFKHEKYMIAILGRKDMGTGILRNLTDGGEGASGAVRSKETREKMSEVHKGKTHSEESKRKISESKTGKNLSEEHKMKISESLMGENNPNYGKTFSEEIRRKMSESRKGENHPFYGKKHSEESKRKISEARKEYIKNNSVKENVTDHNRPKTSK